MASNNQQLSKIRIVGARENNLKNLDVALPKGALVAIAGVSGAGKSTLAHHILARIGRRRLGRLRAEGHALAPAYDPCVDSVDGLPPCIELRQEPLHGQSRSTIATYTGLIDIFANLFLRFGTSMSGSNTPVLPAKDSDLSEWFWQHWRGKVVTLAQIRPEVTVASADHLPKETFYFREKRTVWTKGTRSSSKLILPAKWWIAEPCEHVRIEAREDITRLVRVDPGAFLWICQDTFLEGGVHRIAANDPTVYEPLGRRLFSFNTAGPGGGQCPTCKGLGNVRGVNESSLIRNAELPLLDGGLNLSQTPAGRFTHLGVLDDILRGLFRVNSLPANVSWRKLSSELQALIMRGSGNEPVPELPKGDDRLRSAKRPFLGIVALVMTRAASNGPAAKVFQQWISETPCSECNGSRFNRSARACKWRGHNLTEFLAKRSLSELRAALVVNHAASRNNEAALLGSLDTILAMYDQLNLGHLPLNRATSTLSGGEAQRLKLGIGLALEVRDVCYILDEPSRGLHSQDIEGLAEILKTAVANENSVILVEHQPLLLSYAEHLLVLGPGGGDDGGRIVSKGPPIFIPRDCSFVPWRSANDARASRDAIEIKRLTLHNLIDVAFKIPVAQLTAVVGVSGAGKSSAILRALVPAVRGQLEGAGESPTCSLKMPSSIRFVEVVGQRLAIQNRRSVVATVMEIFDPLREHFAAQADAKALNLAASDFSFNSVGACSACGGTGVARDGFGEEMDTRCHVCSASRLGGPALLVRSAGYGIADLLQMPSARLVSVGHPGFGPDAVHTLSTLLDLGLGHLSLGRATTTLSAGERQRLALARFLAKLEGAAGGGLLVLDEPTAGLSVTDALRIFQRVQTLAHEQGHTVVVLEHKLELLPLSDWIIEFGPGGGPKGGRVVFQGIPADLPEANTPTARAWVGQNQPPRNSRKSMRVERQMIETQWERCADVFEPLAARSEIHDDIELIRPVRPAIHFNSDRIPKDTRVGELLELLPWARSHAKLVLPKGTQAVFEDSDLAVRIEGRSFGFSPVALQLRLGLATPSDLQTAVRGLSRLGFCDALGPKGPTTLRGLLTQISSSIEIAACVVVCPITVSETMRTTALRWSQGVIHDVIDPGGQVLTTKFITEGLVGLDLNAPFVGDCRSPQGRCVQCIGSGRLQVYPWKLIVSDERRAIADDSFWHPAVLMGIRSLRRSRILPEAEFFARELVADFRQPPAIMDSRTRFLFEHGVPWRRFVKPSASRSDRVQDYYSWRGLHDYVYLALGRISDVKHKQALKDGFREIPCPSCSGTGMGWETKCLQLDREHIQAIWQSSKLREWRSRFDCKNRALIAALKLELDDLRANDRYGDLPRSFQERLLIALSYTAPLEGLTLVSSMDNSLNRKLIEAIGMRLVTSEVRVEQTLQ